MNVISRPRHDTAEIAASWLASFGAALEAGDAKAAARISPPTATGATCWPSPGASGPAAAAPRSKRPCAHARANAATNLHLPDDRSPPRRVRRAGTDCIETIFEFETASGHANAVVRLVERGRRWRAWTLVTTLEELHGCPDGRPPEVSDAESYSRDFGGENWLDQRSKALAYADRDPTVLIVGGGQAGLSVAARLKAARRRHADRRPHQRSATTGAGATTR